MQHCFAKRNKRDEFEECNHDMQNSNIRLKIVYKKKKNSNLTNANF